MLNVDQSGCKLLPISPGSLSHVTCQTKEDPGDEVGTDHTKDAQCKRRHLPSKCHGVNMTCTSQENSRCPYVHCSVFFLFFFFLLSWSISLAFLLNRGMKTPAFDSFVDTPSHHTITKCCKFVNPDTLQSLFERICLCEKSDDINFSTTFSSKHDVVCFNKLFPSCSNILL